MDEGTVAVSIDLKACLVPDPTERAKPLNYHERTGHILPQENNLLQFFITDTENFVQENRLVINKQKTKVISFTKSRNWDFPPEVKFSDGSQIEYIPDTKLVGVVVSEDLRWSKNTEYICSQAKQKLWILRRMLKLDLDIHRMYDVYVKEIRSILEMAVPVWHSGLTKLQSSDIERIQKIAFKIILQQNYVSYKQACSVLSAQTLQQRRVKLCTRFASKNLKGENSMFTRVGSHVNTRHKSDIVKEYKCNFGRFKKSSLPYLARLLNENNRKR